MKKALLVTLYNPQKEFIDHYLSLIRSVDEVVFVDNSPSPIFSTIEGSHVILNYNFDGLSGALNTGLDYLKKNNFNAVILFDQDSRPSNNLINALFKLISDENLKSSQCLAICPSHVSYDDIACEVDDVDFIDLEPIMSAPTSGMCINLDLLNENRFNQNYFLDIVDFEFTWRLRSLGFKFYRAQQLGLQHKLGLTSKKFFIFTYNIPDPIRHYYQFRDTLKALCLPYAPFYAKFRLTIVLPIKFFIYPFITDNGIARFKFMFFGLIDGFKKVRGRYPRV